MNQTKPGLLHTPSLKVLEYLVLGFLAIIPLVSVPAAIEFYEIAKLYVLTGVALLSLYFTRKFLKEFFYSRLARALTLYIGWVLVAAIFGVDIITSLLGGYYRGDGLLGLLALSVLSIAVYVLFSHSDYTKGLKVKFIYALVCGGLLVSALGFIQFLVTILSISSIDQLLTSPVVSTLGKSTFVAGFLLILLPLTTDLGNAKVKLLIRVVFIFAIILTYSKIAIFLMIGYFIVSSIKKHLNTEVVGVMVALCFFLFTLWLTRGFDPVLKGMSKTGLNQFQKYPYIVSPSIAFDDLRFKVLGAAQLAILQSPIFGYGIGNIDSALYGRPIPFKRNEVVLIDSSHNMYFDIALESGIPGLVLYIVLNVLLIEQLVLLKEDTFQWIVWLFLARGLFDITSYAMWIVYFAILGYVVFKQQLVENRKLD